MCVVLRSAALPPDQLFSDGQGETPLLDLEGLQFEGAVEGEGACSFQFPVPIPQGPSLTLPGVQHSLGFNRV